MAETEGGTVVSDDQAPSIRPSDVTRGTDRSGPRSDSTTSQLTENPSKHHSASVARTTPVESVGKIGGATVTSDNQVPSLPSTEKTAVTEVPERIGDSTESQTPSLAESTHHGQSTIDVIRLYIFS